MKENILMFQRENDIIFLIIIFSKNNFTRNMFLYRVNKLLFKSKKNGVIILIISLEYLLETNNLFNLSFNF